MSMEGYWQILCPRGHYNVVDYWDDGPFHCDECYSVDIYWKNLVTMVNTDDDSGTYVDMDKFYLGNEVYKLPLNCCGCNRRDYSVGEFDGIEICSPCYNHLEKICEG